MNDILNPKKRPSLNFSRRLRLLSLIIFILSFFFSAWTFAFNSIAFYYGAAIPWDELHAFDIVVVQPSIVKSPNIYKSKTTQIFAYISVGEISPTNKNYSKIPQSWLIGKNKIWKSEVLDQSNPKWQQFFIDHIITPLWNRGYRGFFFDTMDSYQLAAKKPEEQKKQEAGLIRIIHLVKQHYPKANIILNRGFEIIPNVNKDIIGVAAESLFYGWDEQKQEYYKINSNDHNYLLKELKTIHQEYHKPIVVIDYLPPNQRAKARMIAMKIKQLGFIPWVTNATLSSVGISSVEVIPRKILVLVDTLIAPDISLTSAAQLGVMPLENMGYKPIFHNVADPLPKFIMPGRYAGILVWLDTNTAGVKQHLNTWLQKQMRDNVPIVFFQQFGFPLSKKNLEPYGIKVIKSKIDTQKIEISKKTNLMGFEIHPSALPSSFHGLFTKIGNVLLQLKAPNGEKYDAAAITPWGGYVLYPYVVTDLPNHQIRWVVSPFEFYRKALRLKKFPVPDVTTENGLRLMMVHIDGDGFISQAEWYNGSFAGEEAEKKILNTYRIPTTVSIIQGELSPDGKNTKRKKAYIEAARRIFQLPWVELASHTYSHPFNWRELEEKKQGKNLNIFIPGYRFSWDKEVSGSVDFINNVLAPKNKKVKVYLWSGDSNPSSIGVKKTYQVGICNVNGGETTISNTQKSLTNIAPLGISKGGYYQVYAPMQNENIYTNNFKGPFYGYERVIETYKLTNKPHRYKPINIYYHFYSLTKKSSYRALKKVYNWALSQPVFNIYLSEYAQMVLDWRKVVISKPIGSSNTWLIRNNGTVHEFRVPQTMGHPSLTLSKNVIGYNTFNDDYYIHLGPADKTQLVLTTEPQTIPYLYSANAFVTQFERTANGFKLKLKNYTPLKFILANTEDCKITFDGNILKGKNVRNNLTECHINNNTYRNNYELTTQCKNVDKTSA